MELKFDIFVLYAGKILKNLYIFVYRLGKGYQIKVVRQDWKIGAMKKYINFCFNSFCLPDQIVNKWLFKYEIDRRVKGDLE